MKNSSIILLLVSVALYGLVIRDYQTESTNLSKQAQQLEQTISLAQAELTGLKAQEKELGEKLTLSFERIPPESRQEELIRDLQQISARSGFQFKALSFGQSFNSDIGTDQVTISFNVKGAYGNLFTFLRAIETNQRFLGMNDLRLAISEDKSAGRNISTDITLYALYQN